MVFHWFALFVAYCASFVRFVPSLWPAYFRFLEAVLLINDREYRRALCVKRTAAARAVHFATFAVMCYAAVTTLSSERYVNLLLRGGVALGYLLAYFGIASSLALIVGRLLMGMECGGSVASVMLMKKK